MAHWIIEDQGFSGMIYRCSHCRSSWNDIFDDVSSESVCPECGEPINEDEVEFLERPKSIREDKSVRFKIKVYELITGKDVTDEREWYIDVDGNLLFMTDDIDSPLYDTNEYYYKMAIEII